MICNVSWKIELFHTRTSLEPTRDSTESSGPPDGAYGWLCVLAQFLINAFTWGTVVVFSFQSLGILTIAESAYASRPIVSTWHSISPTMSSSAPRHWITPLLVASTSP